MLINFLAVVLFLHRQHKMEDSVQEFISSCKCLVAQDSSLNQIKDNIIVSYNL